jgi:hypothetical protein
VPLFISLFSGLKVFEFEAATAKIERVVTLSEIDSSRQSVLHRLPVAASDYKFSLAQDTQVVRQQILRDSDVLVDLFDVAWTIKQNFEYRQPRRVGQHCKLRRAVS